MLPQFMPMMFILLLFVVAAGPEYRKLAVNRLGEQVMATPAISEGRLYFRTLQSLVAVA